MRLHENIGSDISVPGSAEDESPQVCSLAFSCLVCFILDIGRGSGSPPTLGIIRKCFGFTRAFGVAGNMCTQLRNTTMGTKATSD